MISLEHVSKRYVVEHVPRKWVLRDVSLRIPFPVSVGVVGGKGTGKSTLLDLISGAEEPTEGKVRSSVRVSHPRKYMRNLQPLLSGRQNARFICRLGGYVDDIDERIARIEAIARLGPALDRPVKSYSFNQKSQLSFALSWVLDFDVYVADAFNFAGQTAFRDQALAASELERRMATAGFVMAAKGPQAEALLKERCKAGIWVHDGKAEWFDNLDDAIQAYRTSHPEAPRRSNRKDERALASVPEGMRPVLQRVQRLRAALLQLNKGLLGQTATVAPENIERLLRVARDAGVELVTRKEMAERELVPAAGAAPVVRVDAGGEGRIEYFDVRTQSTRAGEPGQAGLA